LGAGEGELNSEFQVYTESTLGSPPSQILPLSRLDVCLAEDTSQRANRHFAFLGDDHRIHDPAGISHELDVAAFLAGFDETGGLKPAFDFSEG
jgi:hypothetical protein